MATLDPGSAKAGWMAGARAGLSPARLIPALLIGTIIGLIEIALAASFAALIFEGELRAHLSRGIGMALFSGTVSLILITLLSSLPTMIGGNQDAPAAIVAVAAGAVAATVVSAEARFATVAVVVALTTLVAGLSLLLLGTFKLAGLVRFLPYPVAGGFLAGTGWLLLIGGLSTMTDVPFSFGNLAALVAPRALVYWLPGLLFGVLMVALSNRIRHYLFLPGMIAAIIALFYLVAVLLGASVAELGEAGWLLGPFPEGRMWQPISPAELGQVQWSAIGAQLPSLIAAVAISAIALLLNASGLELVLRRDVDLNREMRAAGWANAVAALGGGLTSYQQLGLSVLNGRAGANSRLTGLFAAVVCGLVLVAGGAALAVVPKLVFGALLVYLGVSFLWEWVFVAWKRLPRIDYLIILMILVIIAMAGFLQGVAVGIIAAVVMFVVSYSRSSVIKHELNGLTFRSRVTRSAEDRAMLETLGEQAYFLQLQGFIFFGTAYGLLEKVRARVRATPTRYVAFDFHQVTGLDSTALLSFDKMRQLGRDEGFTLVLAGLSPALRRQFDQGGVREEAGALRFAPDLDRAAEWCEDQLCTLAGVDPAARTLADHLRPLIPSDAVDRLLARLERREIAAGEHLIRQGDAPDRLFLIESGQLTAQLESPEREPVRLQTMRGGYVVGELGFYLGTQRSAAVVADRPSVVYALSQQALAQIEAEDPAAAHAFHRAIVHLLGDRVLHLMRAVDALQS